MKGLVLVGNASYEKIYKFCVFSINCVPTDSPKFFVYIEPR